MANISTKTAKNGVFLDTLAQLDRNYVSKPKSNPIEVLQKRAFAKYYTMELIYPLIDLKNEREKAYWNTFHCASELTQFEDGRITAKYCKNRWCIVCNKIRTGILHNTHKKALQTVKTKFVTLTTPLTSTCVTKEDLASAYSQMTNAFQKAWRRTKIKYGKLMALRKTETTWEYYRGTFHPHFHIIIENNTDEAEYLVKQWLLQFPNANPKAQNIIDTDNKVYNETFKYLCKMWDTKHNKNTNKYEVILPYPVQKMDDIFSVFYGKRIIQTYNLKKVELEDFSEIKATVFLEEQTEYVRKWNWIQQLRTWVDKETGELRTAWKDFSKKDFDTE